MGFSGMETGEHSTRFGPWHHRASHKARHDAGRARRKFLPLESHAEISTDEEREDPLVLLAQQDKARDSALIPIRYGRMSQSPFTFLRGAATVMAADLARRPWTDLKVQMGGDSHLGNFRFFHSPDRRLVFDLNDFDETLPGPFEWDVKRLATSVMIAARNNELGRKKCRAAVLSAVGSYRETIAHLAKLSRLDVHYYRIEVDDMLAEINSKKGRERTEEVGRKASGKNSLRALAKLTDIVDGRRVIVPDPPLVQPLDTPLAVEEFGRLSQLFELYRDTLPQDRRHVLDYFSLVDMANKVVGVGSVGTRCKILLLESGGGVPLFLQFKEASASVYEKHLGYSPFENAGQRVVEGQRMIQAASDIFLGYSRWTSSDDTQHDFYIRQLWDGKGRFDIDNMGAGALTRFAGFCGKAMARGHARSGDVQMIRGYLGKSETFDHAIADFATSYAERTESDHAQLCKAIEKGTIEAIQDI
jgi:uncharacterized protein (DUF2252 family)